MKVPPALAAFDRAAQRRAQAAMAAVCEAWRAAPLTATLTELERYGAGVPLAVCPTLTAIISGPDAARGLMADLCRLLAVAMHGEPFGHPPLRHGFDGTTASLQLARSGRAELVLLAIQPCNRDFTSASFSDGERHEAILAGVAQARLVRCESAGNTKMTLESLALTSGVRRRLDCDREALQVVSVERTLVTLRLLRTAANPRPTRSYALAEGALLHQAAGEIRASRHEMMLAVLGRMRRTEAAPVMAGVVREPGDASLRWQALRECLALDTEVGFRTLVAIARSAGDPLAAQAGALRAQLVEAHPELLVLEAACRA